MYMYISLVLACQSDARMHTYARAYVCVCMRMPEHTYTSMSERRTYARAYVCDAYVCMPGHSMSEQIINFFSCQSKFLIFF